MSRVYDRSVCKECPLHPKCNAIPNGQACTIRKRCLVNPPQHSGCEICNSEFIEIEVKTLKDGEYDTYLFSTNAAVGLLYCPKCGRDIRKEVR